MDQDRASGALTAHNTFRLLQVLTLIPAWALTAAIIGWSLSLLCTAAVNQGRRQLMESTGTMDATGVHLAG